MSNQNTYIKQSDEYFCGSCGSVLKLGAKYCPSCGMEQSTVLNTLNSTDKNKYVAALLAFFLGGIGIHKFYLGQIGKGVIYLLFCWTFIPTLIALIEVALLLAMNDQKFQEKFAS